MAFDPAAAARSIDPASQQTAAMVREQLFASNGNPDVMRDQLRETLKHTTPAQSAALLDSFAATDMTRALMSSPIESPNMVSEKESAALVGAVKSLVADGSISAGSVKGMVEARVAGGQVTRGLSEVVAKLDNSEQGLAIKDTVVRTEIDHARTAPAADSNRVNQHPDRQAAFCADASLVNASMGAERATQTYASLKESDRELYVKGALRAEYEGRNIHEGRGGVEKLMGEVASSNHPAKGELAAGMFSAATGYLAQNADHANKLIALDGSNEPTGLRHALNDVASVGMHDVVRNNLSANVGTFKAEMFTELQQYVRASFGDPRNDVEAKRMTAIIGQESGRLLGDAHAGTAAEVAPGFTERDATRLAGHLVGTVMGSQNMLVKDAEKSVADRKESIERVQSLVDGVSLGLGPAGKAGVEGAKLAVEGLEKVSKILDVASKRGPEPQIEGLKSGIEAMKLVRNQLNESVVPQPYITDFQSGYEYGKTLGAEASKLSEGQSAMLEQKAKSAGLPTPAETVAWNGNTRSGRLVEIDDSTYAMSVGRGTFVIIKADQLPAVDLHAAAQTAQLVSVGKNGVESQQPQQQVSMTV